jgi:hypothetical protein
MWMLLVVTIWVNGGVSVENLRVYQHESECQRAQVALVLGESAGFWTISPDERKREIYMCEKAPK